MDKRKPLKQNDRLAFPGLECVIDAPAGRGSSVLAYTGHYPDRQDPRILHRVLIRELFPFDPAEGILRAEDGNLKVGKSAEFLFEKYRESFLRANEVHSRMAEEIPAELDLHINTFVFHNTLYSVMGYTGGRSLEEEMQRGFPGQSVSGPVSEPPSGSDPESDSDSDSYSGSSSETDPEPASLQPALRLLRIIRIVRGALQVLKVFHEAGYLHLDISPDNLLLIGEGERERVTLIDYNSVHTVREIRENTSIKLSWKEGYTAPEVRLGQRAYIGQHSDLFSMTAVFSYCLFGRCLTDLEQIGSVLPDPAGHPSWQDLPAPVLSQLRHILRKGLSPSPKKRYRTASDLLAALDELKDRVEGRGITRWALWESGRSRCFRLMRENISLQYIRDETRIYPLHVETECGARAELFDLLKQTNVPDSLTYAPGKRKPLLLLGGGGTGKTTALFRLAWSAYAPDQEKRREYQEQTAAVFYISLYGYRDGGEHFIRNTLLEGLKFKPETDSLESARRELLRLLNQPGPPVLQLLLDGYNEASGNTLPLLQELRLLAGCPGVQIIMTGRTDPGITMTGRSDPGNMMTGPRSPDMSMTGRSDPGAEAEMPDKASDRLFEKISLCRLAPEEIRRILSEEGILPPESPEVFDLLGFPLLLTIYIEAVKGGTSSPGSLQGREQLLKEYFASLRKKETAALLQNSKEEAGLEAVFQYLLPELAAQIHRAGHSLTDKELMRTVEQCYRELSGKALTTVYPQWIGKTAALKLGAKNADEWYGRAVLEILHKRTGILVRDEQGNLRILHQIMEESLTEKSRQFHQHFDREKRRQKMTRRAGLAAAAFLLVFLFGIYNYRMRLQIEQKQRQMVIAEAEMTIVEAVRNSEEALTSGDREEAVEEAVDAVLLSFADPGQAERVFLEEDGLELLHEDLPLIRDRIPDAQKRNVKNTAQADSQVRREDQNNKDPKTSTMQSRNAPVVQDSYYPALAQNALTAALGVYDLSVPDGQAPSLSYDPSYPHTETRVSADHRTVTLYSLSGFQVLSTETGEVLCTELFPEPEAVRRTVFVREENSSRLEAAWEDGTVRKYDALDGHLILQGKGSVPDLSAPAEYNFGTFRLVSIPGQGIAIYDISSGENLGELNVNADVSLFALTEEGLVIGFDATEGVPRFALLVNENFETLAELQGLCDVLDGEFYFDNMDGRIWTTPVYSLPELLDLARKNNKPQV